MWVIHVEATTLAAALGSPAAMADPDTSQIAQFGFFDPLANIGFAMLFWGGLRYRYKVQLHARYMLASLLFVIAPIGFRLLSRYVPAFNSDTPQTAWRFSFAMGGGNLIAFVIALYLYRWRRNMGGHCCWQPVSSPPRRSPMKPSGDCRRGRGCSPASRP